LTNKDFPIFFCHVKTHAANDEKRPTLKIKKELLDFEFSGYSDPVIPLKIKDTHSDNTAHSRKDEQAFCQNHQAFCSPPTSYVHYHVVVYDHECKAIVTIIIIFYNDFKNL